MCVGWDTLWKKLVKMDFSRYVLESAKVATELTGRKKVETELEPLFPLYVSDMITSDTCILVLPRYTSFLLVVDSASSRSWA